MAIFRRTPPPLPPGTPPPGSPVAAIPSKAAAKAAAAKAQETTRAAPEPLSIILPAIAALGSIASIAAVAWLAEERTADRPKVKRRLDVILKDLETSCLGTAEILRRVIRHSPMFGLLGATSAAPLKFGLLGSRVDVSQGHIYVQLVNDVATMLVLATQASFDATNAIEDGDLTPSEALIYKFGDAQAKLTVLLSSRASLKTTVETALAVAESLVICVRELKALRSSESKV
jgi:hypothetical protein